MRYGGGLQIPRNVNSPQRTSRCKHPTPSAAEDLKSDANELRISESASPLGLSGNTCNTYISNRYLFADYKSLYSMAGDCKSPATLIPHNVNPPQHTVPRSVEEFSNSKDNHLRILVTNEAIDTKMLMELTQ